MRGDGLLQCSEVNLRGVISGGKYMSRNEIIPYNSQLKNLARTLRKNMTYAEVLLWNKIRRRSLGYQFHRQVPLVKFIVDFYCHELRLAIEVDGKYHDHLEVNVHDYERQEIIKKYGVHFLRFYNKEIKKDIDSVVQEIENWIELMPDTSRPTRKIRVAHPPQGGICISKESYGFGNKK